MGLVINKPAPLMAFSDLLEKIDIETDVSMVSADVLRIPVRLGGPVEQFRGFVLHSRDYKADESSLKISDDYILTATVDVLKDIARGNGPNRYLITLGYSGWAPGQLENEIQNNGWLHCDAEMDLVFADDLEKKHFKALKTLGFDPRMLSSDVGHA